MKDKELAVQVENVWLGEWEWYDEEIGEPHLRESKESGVGGAPNAKRHCQMILITQTIRLG